MNSASRQSIRALLTSLHQAAVQGADPFVRTRDAVAAWIARNPIAPSTRVHLFALGKAGAAMAAGAVRALREANHEVSGGVAVIASKVPSAASAEQGGTLPSTIAVRVGDHPVPDIGSLAASEAIARAVLAVEDDDLAIVLISGGATSLCAAPCTELVQAFGRADSVQHMLGELATTLHESGLTIHEMNAVRRRLLRWTAGRLAVALYERGASVIPTFAISDVIGDDPSVIGSGPCSPDPNDLAGALALMGAMELQNKVSRKLGVLLGLNGRDDDMIMPPRVSHPAFSLVSYQIVARNRDSCLAMANAARAQDIDTVMISDVPLSGEAETLGHVVSASAIRAAELSSDAQLIVWGGEPIVRMDAAERVQDGEDEGPLPHTLNIAGEGMRATAYMQHEDSNRGEVALGGRMQALALASCLALEQAAFHGQAATVSRVTILAAGTDGRDGPTDACGAIVDSLTPDLARDNNRDPIRDLHRFRSYYALDAAHALLKTGPTGTNVMDVVAAYIAAESPGIDRTGLQ